MLAFRLSFKTLLFTLIFISLCSFAYAAGDCPYERDYPVNIKCILGRLEKIQANQIKILQEQEKIKRAFTALLKERGTRLTVKSISELEEILK